jgi:hypothetical protein
MGGGHFVRASGEISPEHLRAGAAE